jgi:hypothetical protein
MNRRNFITRSGALLAFAGTVPAAIAQSLDHLSWVAERSALERTRAVLGSLKNRVAMEYSGTIL